jgi:hypothetical protein
MNCPTDGTTLLMSERNGIEIDYCPQCRGVWLDRGELDKILERAKAESAHEAPQAQPFQAQPQQYQQPEPSRGYEPRYDERRDSHFSNGRDPRYGDPRYRKKKSPFEFLGDIFD